MELKSFDSSAMASSPFFNDSNQVSRSVPGKIHHGQSKAQMCLQKIISIITSRSSLQPCEISRGSLLNGLNPQFGRLESEADGFREKPRASSSGKRGLDIDLNLRLGPAPDTIESVNPLESEGFSACSGVGEADSKVCGAFIDCNSSALSGDVSTVDKSSQGECDPKDAGNSSGTDFPAVEANINGEEEPEVLEKQTKEVSEITNLQGPSSEKDDSRILCEETEDGEQSKIKGKGKAEQEEEDLPQQQEGEPHGQNGEGRKLSVGSEYKGEGYLGLLVEAARLISGNFEEDNPEPETRSRKGELEQESTDDETPRTAETETERKGSVRCGSKRNQCTMFDLYGGFEDISPVVRSKRGRNQVLPCRYRDSVLEPLKRLSRQRSTRVSTKQRPR